MSPTTRAQRAIWLGPDGKRYFIYGTFQQRLYAIPDIPTERRLFKKSLLYHRLLVLPWLLTFFGVPILGWFLLGNPRWLSVLYFSLPAQIWLLQWIVLHPEIAALQRSEDPGLLKEYKQEKLRSLPTAAILFAMVIFTGFLALSAWLSTQEHSLIGVLYILIWVGFSGFAGLTLTRKLRLGREELRVG